MIFWLIVTLLCAGAAGGAYWARDPRPSRVDYARIRALELELELREPDAGDRMVLTDAPGAVVYYRSPQSVGAMTTLLKGLWAEDRLQKTYYVEPADDGRVWHHYSDGRKVLVPADDVV
jgi:hypothetical protein